MIGVRSERSVRRKDLSERSVRRKDLSERGWGN
jgi:hypothetical protein